MPARGFRRRGGAVTYEGDAHIDGVPGTAAPVSIAFEDTAGSSCGALFPSGHVAEQLCGVEVTLIDNGMPCVILQAADLGLKGDETPLELEANTALRDQLEAIRLEAGRLMNMGDVRLKSVPKLTLVSPALAGGDISTRTFIPHRCHQAIGVLGAVSVATACMTAGAVGHDLAKMDLRPVNSIGIEHPSGQMTVICHQQDEGPVRAAVVRTARKLMDGVVY